MKKNLIIDDDFYTVKEVAGFLEIIPQTVSNYLRKGQLKGKKRGPKNKWYVSGTEVKRIMRDWNLI